jgi:hypothetical protein
VDEEPLEPGEVTRAGTDRSPRPLARGRSCQQAEMVIVEGDRPARPAPAFGSRARRASLVNRDRRDPRLTLCPGRCGQIPDHEDLRMPRREIGRNLEPPGASRTTGAGR